MYIKKYWGNFIGGSDDSLNPVSYTHLQLQTHPMLGNTFLFPQLCDAVSYKCLIAADVIHGRFPPISV